MKKFFLKLFVFFAPIAILSYSLDVMISNNLRKSNAGENSDWRDIYDGTINSDILIYGSSRAWQIIHPQTISDSLHQNTYNLGIQAHNFWLQYLRHRLLLKYNKKPKVIIQSLDFLTFQKRPDLYDPGQFLPYMLFDTLITKYTTNYKGYTWFDYTVPLVRYYGQMLFLHRAFSLYTHKIPDPPDRIKGYMAYDMPFTNVFTDGKLKIKSYHIQFDTATIRLFDKYLLECRENKIKMIFVYTPEYIAGQRFVANRDQLFELIHRFSKIYNIPFYDYSNDTICYKTAYFYNSEHLNKAGSLLFSKKFAHDLKLGDMAARSGF